ncbi:MAG TPA: GspH/FimT family pseudopilin [Verrucomicrobiae bacterium]|nr:GspH/FimT family pseudopilin [Verrucomicrobiae bacterium]
MLPGATHAVRARRRGAFTLIEIMVVMVLIGIMSAMVIPEMRGTFEDALLRSTARELMGVIELASSRAISMNQTLRVTLDPLSGRYEIERLKRDGLAEDFVPLADVPHSSGQLDKRIAIQIHNSDEISANAGNETQSQVSTPELVFNPDGTAQEALILLKDRAGFRLALHINPITSRVDISEPKHE